MADPVMIAVAVALATNAVDGLAQTGRSTFAALARLVRRKLAADPERQDTLIAARADPDSEPGVRRLADALDGAAAADGAFAAELRRLWNSVREEQATLHGGVSNSAIGTLTGPVVQARDVHGGISFGRPDGSVPDRSLPDRSLPDR